MSRPAERVSALPVDEPDELGITSALASTRSGTLLEPHLASEHLCSLAATLPEVFGTLDPELLQRIAERIGVDASSHELNEVLLLSESRVHVMQPLAGRPNVALLAISPATGSIGLLLSRVRARTAELEEEK
ncbi:MAG TPA: hypothetical protein VJN18_25760 [Polyangiaceae bacterium]|nr:hypothetical protein [Polyangiaceae bacterium]